MRCKLPVFVDCTYHKYYWYYTRFEDDPKVYVAISICIWVGFNILSIFSILASMSMLLFGIKLYEYVTGVGVAAILCPPVLVYTYLAYIKSGYCDEVINPKQPEHLFFKTRKGTIIFWIYTTATILGVFVTGFLYRYLTLGYMW